MSLESTAGQSDQEGESQSLREKCLMNIRNHIKVSREVYERVLEVLDMLRKENPNDVESIKIVEESVLKTEKQLKVVESYETRKYPETISNRSGIESQSLYTKGQALFGILQGYLFLKNKYMLDNQGNQSNNPFKPDENINQVVKEKDMIIKNLEDKLSAQVQENEELRQRIKELEEKNK